jgi:RNA polymerase sigma factor (sigma-70 family)
VRRHDAEDLWRRFGAGDGSAFAQLYRDHHRDVFRYCRSLLHDEEDAHDAAQCTWTALWTVPGAARREIPLRPWLFRVAHNEAVSILRRRRRHEELTDLEVPSLDDVASDVELRDRLATLRADLVSLPERQRAALLLREVAGLGHNEIADVFGISTAAAKQTIYEARRALREAEGGRSMACDLVQAAISDGDGRVRRGRRLRAHLRGCATCRMFADAVGRRRRDLELLFPAPAGIGVLAAAVGSGAGAGAGGAGASLVAAGGSALAKVAVAVVVVAGGVAGRHEIAHAGAGRAAGTTASGAMAAAPHRARAPAPRRAVGGGTTTAAPRRADGRPALTRARAGGTAAGSRSAGRGGADDPPADSAAQAGVSAAAQQTAATDGASYDHSGDAPGPAKAPGAAEPHGQRVKAGAAGPPGQSKKAGAAGPPGQSKKAGAAGPPGQTKKPAVAGPPGQSRKTDAPGAAAGSATSAVGSPAPAAATSAPTGNGTATGKAAMGNPPGQAKADTPPGQSKE